MAPSTLANLGDGGPAGATSLRNPQGVAFGPDGSLYISDSVRGLVRRVSIASPGFAITDIAIASTDGSQLYQFSGSGRHLRTLDSLTGAVVYSFVYDSAGRLATITDRSGNVTRVERDTSGAPVAIVAPGGQRTSLSVDRNGFLSGITDPAGDVLGLTSTAGGLLTSLTDPGGGAHKFSYDKAGRLTNDADPAGGSTTLARTDTVDGFTVRKTSALGRVTSYEVHYLGTGATPESHRRGWGDHRDGAEHRWHRHRRLPQRRHRGRDHRPRPPVRHTGPDSNASGRDLSGPCDGHVGQFHAVTLADPTNVLSVQSMTDTITVNGQPTAFAYQAGDHSLTTTSPEGRKQVVTLDSQARPVQIAPPGVDPIQVSYGPTGLIVKVAQGAQSESYGYDASNRVTTRTDALGEQTQASYDAADRPVTVTMPNGAVYRYSFDANGNRTGITPPSGTTHLLGYSPVNLESSYTPPGNAAYTSTFNADRQRTTANLPSGAAETFGYDPGGRLTALTEPQAATAVAYSDATRRPTALTRTPAGGGTAQGLSLAYGADVVTQASFTGPTAGQFSYRYDANFLLAGVTLDANPEVALTRDRDGLLTGYGSFSFTPGATGDPAQISDGTGTLASATTPQEGSLPGPRR